MGRRSVGGTGGKLLVRTSVPRTLLLVLGSALMTAASGALCVAYSISFYEGIAESPAWGLVYGLVVLPVFFVSLAGLVLFGWGLVFFLQRLLFFRSPVLEVGPRGILDRASLIGVGFVPWEAVGRVEFVDLRGQRLLAIRLRHGTRLLEQQNPVKRLLLRANRRFFPGSQINVPLSALAISEEKLAAEILRHIEPRGDAGARLGRAATPSTKERAQAKLSALGIARAAVRWVALVLLSLLYFTVSAGLLGFGGALVWNSLGPGRFSDFDHPVAGSVMLVSGALFFVLFPRLVKRITGREVISPPYGGF